MVWILDYIEQNEDAWKQLDEGDVTAVKRSRDGRLWDIRDWGDVRVWDRARRTGYVRDGVVGRSPVFIKKGVEQPDTTTGGGDQEKAAELPELRQNEARPPDKQQRAYDVEAKALLENRIKRVLAKAKAKWPDPQKRPGFNQMAGALVARQPNKKFEKYGQEALRKILANTYKPAKVEDIPELSSW